MDDGAEGLWRVHDKLYDLTSFMKNHPGGEEWLELTKVRLHVIHYNLSLATDIFARYDRGTEYIIKLDRKLLMVNALYLRDVRTTIFTDVTHYKGTDITEAFETHHLSLHTGTLLDKFYIRDAATPRNSPFTFAEDGFYKTIKRAAQQELKKIPKSVSTEAAMITDGLFVTLLCSSPLACLTNYWAGSVCYIVASVSLALLTVACHNYIHRRSNWRMYLFNLSMWSYRDFRISHVLSHHLYTNTLMDLEISSLEPFLFYNPRKDKPLHARIGFITELFFFPCLFPLSFAKRIIYTFRGKYRLQWHDLVCLLLPMWMFLVTGAPFIHVLKTWLYIVCSASFVFYMIGVTAAHHHPEAIKDGDQSRSEYPDWGVHQMEALLDRKDVNNNIFTVITLFGDHALHHMFPTLDHAVLRYLHPILMEHAEKFQANYRMSTQFNMVIGQIRETMRTNFRPAAKM